MGEISTLLQQKVGLSQEQADASETEVVTLIRARVPSQFQGMVDSFLGGGQPAGGEQPASSAIGGLGGLLGAAEGMMGGNR
jgi:hypothetical protein